MNEQEMYKRLIEAKGKVDNFDIEETTGESELTDLQNDEKKIEEIIKEHEDALLKVRLNIKIKAESIKEHPQKKLQHYEICLSDKMRMAVTNACNNVLDKTISINDFKVIEQLNTKLGTSNATCSDYEKFVAHTYRVLVDNNKKEQQKDIKPQSAPKYLSLFAIFKSEFFERGKNK
jgi:hypothetical protein